MACIATLAAACARAEVVVEKMGFEVAGGFERGAAVSGELRIPASANQRLPAVLILHGSAGVDGRGASYAEPLNRAGIATLEIDMFQGRGRPVTTRHNMAHAFQSLKYLDGHPRIDGTRVGVMGFSWGGVMSVVSSSQEIAREFGGGLRFAAHLGLYPVCWSHLTIIRGTSKFYRPSTYQRLTGSPVHILAGEKDDYDAPETCGQFLAAVPADVRRHIGLTMYPGATHMWDARAGGSAYDSASALGKGGIVQFKADPEVAKRSREFAVEFFVQHLRPGAQ